MTDNKMARLCEAVTVLANAGIRVDGIFAPEVAMLTEIAKTKEITAMSPEAIRQAISFEA